MSKGTFTAGSGREPGTEDPTDQSDRSDNLTKRAAANSGKRLRPSGGYRQLRSFQVTTIIYDATVAFCARFVDKRSRTVDQMVQAARSGRQNIAEGSRTASTSSQTELRLVNVARASLDELLLDYEDFLRQRKLHQWSKDDPAARKVRAVGFTKDPSDQSDPTDLGDQARWALYAPWLEHQEPSVVANTVICLIHQANYLLDQQIVALERNFIKEGGYSEQLATARIAERERARRGNNADLSDPTDHRKVPLPDCPLCGKLMTLRTARQGKNAGSQFFGCTGYPGCKGVLPAEVVKDQADRSHPTDLRGKP